MFSYEYSNGMWRIFYKGTATQTFFAYEHEAKKWCERHNA